MSYVSGFLLAVPTANKDAYRKIAEDTWAIFRNHSCLATHENWVAGWRPHAERLVEFRLKSLTGWLKGRDWLAGRFGVADIVMATFLRGLESEPVLRRYPDVAAYLDRCLARPGFKQALSAQLATFAENEPA